MYSILKSTIFYVLFAIAMISLPLGNGNQLNAAQSHNESTEIAKGGHGGGGRHGGHHGGHHGSSHWRGGHGGWSHGGNYYGRHGGYYNNYSPYYSYGYSYPHYSSYSNSSSSYPGYYYSSSDPYNDTYPYDRYYGSGLGFSIDIG